VLGLSDYGPRRAARGNLVVGLVLVLLSVLGLISVVTSGVSGPSLAGSAVAIFALVFLGGYEIGKYAESRISKHYRTQ
jgi:hypothetical protein